MRNKENTSRNTTFNSTFTWPVFWSTDLNRAKNNLVAAQNEFERVMAQLKIVESDQRLARITYNRSLDLNRESKDRYEEFRKIVVKMMANNEESLTYLIGKITRLERRLDALTKALVESKPGSKCKVS